MNDRRFLSSAVVRDTMMKFWRANVLPETSTLTGKEFERAMIIERGGNWGYHDEPGYSSVPILT